MTNILPIFVAVLNSLWQAALVAVLVWLAMKFLARKNRTINAATRHVIWWATLAVVLVLPVAPRMMGVMRAREQPRAITAKSAPSPRLGTPEIVAPTVLLTLKEERVARWPLWILAIWAVIFFYRIAQIVRSYIYLRGVKRRSSISPQALPPLARTADLLLSGDVVSPMAVGFLRPAVILPDCLPDEIAGAELEHVLLHEAAHLARYDDWTNLAIRVLGAALALHPVALWILRQIEREREMACDDWVVARTGAARPYAASLARMSELRWSRRKDFPGLRLASGLFGGGSRVGDRIEMLLKRGREFSPRVSLLRIVVSAVVLLMFVLAGSRAPRWIAFAQQPDRPSFEVASVKPGDPTNPHVSLHVQPGGRFTATNASLRMLVGGAYNLRNHQISGGPNWLDTATFDIEAKAGLSFTDGPGAESQMRLMVQSLLAERFKLTVHRETREEPVYELVVEKAGSKLKVADSTPSARPGIGRDGVGSYKGAGVRLPQLANWLSQRLGRAVVDRTGLTAAYDFTLNWSPDPGVPTGPDAPALSDSSGPSLFTAVQEDLGLKLQSTKGQVEILVIDHVEKPDAN